MFFGKGRKQEIASEPRPYANFVVKKIAPNLSLQSERILDSARKSFPKGIYENGAARDLIRLGHSTSQLVAVVLAEAAENARAKEVTDIEYGDCALAAHFLMRIPLRGIEEAIDEIIGEWFKAFEMDVHYLVFADAAVTFSDLIEGGNDRYLHYEGHNDAKLPQAYFFLLAKVMLQREKGEWEPYRLLDPMLAPDPVLLGSFDAAWTDIGSMIQHWMDTVLEVQKQADKNDLEVWEWW